jgi:phosphatidate phosphatase APP1
MGRLEGWIYEPEEEGSLRATFVAALEKAIGVTGDDLRAGLAVQRIRPFIYDDERGERVDVAVAGQYIPASVSTKGGRFHVPLRLDFFDGPPPSGEVTVQVVTKKGDTRDFSTTLFVLPAQGRLIVSDIDDTIKDSKVMDKKELLRRTFLEPFVAVPGMAEVYTRWIASAPQGGHLHFVSSSPWQLFNPLSKMIESEGFPRASYALRNFRVEMMDSIDIMLAPEGLKRRWVEAALRPLPKWTAVLVGDSGERDPEIYAQIARNYPGRIERIYIRDVTGEARDSERYKSAFEGLAADCCVVFKSAEELPEQP